MPIIDFDSVEHLLARNLLDLPSILRDTTGMTRRELGVKAPVALSHENIRKDEPKRKSEVLTLLQQMLGRL